MQLNPGPSVTVLVCTRDRPVLLARCLESLLAGQDRPDEVLVVDQGRDDRGRQVVAQLHDDGLRHLPDPRTGLSLAQNLGLAEARSEVVLVTDDDCVLPPDWVATGRAAFAADPALALLAGRILPLGPDEPGRLPVSTRTSTAPLELDWRTAPWDVGSGNNFGVRRAAALAVGGNDERLGPGAPLLGGADMDLFRRVLRSGAGGRYEPRLVVLHERATPAERLGRRFPYGCGMGACLVLWHRQGDDQARRYAVRWAGMRLRRLAGGLKRRDPLRVREELLVLRGTVRGLREGRRAVPGPVTSLRPAPAADGAA